jgi:hypothetical protein
MSYFDLSGLEDDEDAEAFEFRRIFDMPYSKEPRKPPRMKAIPFRADIDT